MEGRRQAYATFLLALAPSSTPMKSHSFMIRSSSPSIFTSVPDHLPNNTRSPALRSMGMSLPASSRAQGSQACGRGFDARLSTRKRPPSVTPMSPNDPKRTSPRRSSGRALRVGINHRRFVPTSVHATLPLSLVVGRLFPFGRGGRLWAPVISRRPVPFSIGEVSVATCRAVESRGVHVDG